MRIVLVLIMLAFVSAAAAEAQEQRCIVTKFKVDCGDRGSAMRTPRKDLWWDDGSIDRLDRPGFERDRKAPERAKPKPGR